MSIRSHITDPRNKNQAFVDSTQGEVQALVVATRPLKTFTNVTLGRASPAASY